MSVIETYYPTIQEIASRRYLRAGTNGNSKMRENINAINRLGMGFVFRREFRTI